MGAIYYVFPAPPATGGDFVAIDHVAALDRHGFRAYAFYAGQDDGWSQFTVPVKRAGTGFGPDDVFVIGENYNWIFSRLRDMPGLKVLHNQNPFYTFFGFDDVAALNAYPFAHVLVPSDFCAVKLRRIGVAHPIARVHPGLPEYFAPGEKKLQIAFSLLKRELEAVFLSGYFKSRVPEYAHVPWVPLARMSRADCAGAMANCAIYATLPQLESLGLMSLEAMASGCHVVGYDGFGGQEYATPHNGDWIADGDHDGFVEHLRAACRLFEEGAHNPRIAAGHATAAVYSQAAFQAQLLAAWSGILGARAPLYRK